MLSYSLSPSLSPLPLPICYLCFAISLNLFPSYLSSAFTLSHSVWNPRFMEFQTHVFLWSVINFQLLIFPFNIHNTNTIAEKAIEGLSLCLFTIHMIGWEGMRRNHFLRLNKWWETTLVCCVCQGWGPKPHSLNHLCFQLCAFGTFFSPIIGILCQPEHSGILFCLCPWVHADSEFWVREYILFLVLAHGKNL